MKNVPLFIAIMILFILNANAQPAGAKYDVSLQLKKATASKVVDNDGNDELYGKMILFGFTTNSHSVGKMTFWEHGDSSGTNGWFKMDMGGFKSRDINVKKIIISNISFNELISGVFNIGGGLADDENGLNTYAMPWGIDVLYTLNETSGTRPFSEYFIPGVISPMYYRTFRMDGGGEYACGAGNLSNQIKAWPADGIERALHVCTGGDTFLELNWVEKDHPDASHETFWWTIWITPHK